MSDFPKDTYKTYEVSRCNATCCPFHFEDKCVLTNEKLSAVIYPLPDGCPLKVMGIKVVKKK